ncbi:unnamed protein product [Effrenium voratum]|uniref:Uncharacterized protein n=1 Tax=Effrenium voratum TaxID=2562239 RepID=A0AA36MZI3_9DINO|nr:unnamed protein product [Effrenium voratum]CAJ1445786.1 unnamed protein product [Effrenium voratum]
MDDDLAAALAMSMEGTEARTRRVEGALVLLPLLPSQKAAAQRRKQQWSHRRSYALWALVVLSLAFAYALAGDLLILDPTMACLRFLGGEGC